MNILGNMLKPKQHEPKLQHIAALPTDGGLYAQASNEYREAVFNPNSQRLSPYGMIVMRMRWVNGQQIPFAHMSVATRQDVVYVFVVTDTSYVVLEDDPNMFPSDKLVTALRLLTP